GSGCELARKSGSTTEKEASLGLCQRLQGKGWSAGPRRHAVNPSMGARGCHPWQPTVGPTLPTNLFGKLHAAVGFKPSTTRPLCTSEPRKCHGQPMCCMWSKASVAMDGDREPTGKYSRRLCV